MLADRQHCPPWPSRSSFSAPGTRPDRSWRGPLAALLPDADIATAGTHVIEGQPMSQRTKLALDTSGSRRPATAAARSPPTTSRVRTSSSPSPPSTCGGSGPTTRRGLPHGHVEAPGQQTPRRGARGPGGWTRSSSPTGRRSPIHEGGDQPEFDAAPGEVVGCPPPAISRGPASPAPGIRAPGLLRLFILLLPLLSSLPHSLLCPVTGLLPCLPPPPPHPPPPPPHR